jgi:hypothetical protein
MNTKSKLFYYKKKLLTYKTRIEETRKSEVVGVAK